MEEKAIENFLENLSLHLRLGLLGDELKRINLKSILYLDPNNPKTEQSLKDVGLAVHYLKATLDRCLGEQHFDANKLSEEGVKYYKECGGKDFTGDVV